MPSTFVGLLIFVTLLSPGLTYTWAKERSMPSTKASIFRETATAAFVSTISITATLILFSILHAVLPSSWTPNIGEIVRQSGPYFRAHYASSLWWGFGIIVSAVILAFIFGRSPGLRNFTNRLAFSEPNPDRFQTEWEAAFTRVPEAHVMLTLTLEDGWTVSGDLASRTAAADETQDRELTLDAPIYMQAPGSDEAVEVEADSIIVSARRISTIMINYVS
ncbi:DUF6338 family protein [Streptomyces sp. NPDC057621]|uniref:DUF6338 family protein n=1 Tax=Streptomyces sp. NPDC057621 TaxID=3346186 RepID=UPI0036771E00